MMGNGNFSKAYPMKGGDSLHSYSNNSTYQRGYIDEVKDLINEAILEKLDINMLSCPNKTIRITDMGCSVGPNTFIAIQNIVEAIEIKYQTHFQFEVYFNDHVSNDFNSLFSSLPLTNKYYSMGVPGSFYGRLFANESLHIVHSSYALQWLSQVPKEVIDKSSSAWNKGKIFYNNEGDETTKAYIEQFGKDMDWFLNCRAKEVVHGGLLLLSFPGRLNETSHFQVYSNIVYHLLGLSLLEMAHKGMISEEKVDSFNIPIYFTSPQEVEEIVERNGCFTIERAVCIPQKKSQESISTKAKAISSHVRAGMESLLKDHFGDDFNIDSLFHHFLHQLHQSLITLQHGVAFTLFFVLKRN